MDWEDELANLVAQHLHRKFSSVNIDAASMYQETGWLVDRDGVVVFVENGERLHGLAN